MAKTQEFGHFSQLLTVNTSTSLVTLNSNFTATDFNSLSDISVKTNISTVEDPLNKLSLLRGVNFQWKANNVLSMGVIAQEIQTVVPELVSEGELKHVNYDGLSALFIEAIKELKNKIEKLEAEIKDLKK